MHVGGGGARVSFFPGAQSPSEREFGWAVGMVKNGQDSTAIEQKIQQAALLRGKKNAERYASLTVQKALAVSRVWPGRENEEQVKLKKFDRL